jgi:hypothetical protein
MNSAPRQVFFQVRRSASHAVVVHCTETDRRALRVIRLSPVSGPVPDASSLLETTFGNKRVLTDAVHEQLKEVASQLGMSSGQPNNCRICNLEGARPFTVCSIKATYINTWLCPYCEAKLSAHG